MYEALALLRFNPNVSNKQQEKMDSERWTLLT